MDAKGMRPVNRLKERLKAGEVCLGATITSASPVTVELFSRLGFDWLWLEMEHTTMAYGDVLTMLQVMNGSDCSGIVRVPWNDKTMLKRVLDAGPEGVIIPLVTSAEEAEYAVRAVKYPPWGERGAGLSRAQCYGLHMGEYMQSANDDVTTILMIEHIKAVENIESILAVKGIDSVMIGALDLSGTMGMLGQTSDPKVEAEVQKVLAACKKAGMPCGIIAIGPEAANQRIAEGFTNIIAGIDILYLLAGASGALGQISRDKPAA